MSELSHEVFVSYAHVDNTPLPGSDKGWVTLLIDNLRNLLVEKLGRSEYLRLWRDPALPGNAELTPTIEAAVRGSATIVLILSRGYLESTWCGRELETFLEHARARGNVAARVFIVEVDDVPRPRLLEDFKGYRFWQRDPNTQVTRRLGYPRPDPDREQEYYSLLMLLSHQLAKELQQPAPMPLPEDRPMPLPEDRPTVYLAEATDDLDVLHGEVKSYLEQAGVRVLPESWYPRDPEAFRAACQGDLAGARLFVQLLSAAPGKRPKDLPEGYVGLQHALARAEPKLPIMQWRSREVDVTRVTDEAHRRLLDGVTVASESLEEFKQRVVQEAKKPQVTAPSPPPGDYFVFVNAEDVDSQWTEAVGAFLDRHEIGYALPLGGAEPAEVRASLREHLLNCDGVLLVYGSTRATWVTAQLHESRRILAKRPRKPRIGVLEVPPAPKAQLNVRLPYLQPIVCHAGLDEAALQQFLTELKPGTAEEDSHDHVNV